MTKDEPKKRMTKKDFEKELGRLQVELCRLQEWVKEKGLRVVVVFEGRDAAGKGGVIKRISERVSADDKRSARLNCITHLLSMIPYKKLPYEAPTFPKRRKRGKGVPEELVFEHTVPEIY